MKKLFLSSIIMFGVCSIVSAQSARVSKLQEASVKNSAVTATPQKAAFTTASDVQISVDQKGAAEKAAAVASDLQTATMSVSDAGEVINNNAIEKKKEMQKIEAAKKVKNN